MDNIFNKCEKISFNEKLQWLKLYDRDQKYTKLVDKYEISYYIREILKEAYLMTLMCEFSNQNDIDFSKQPKKLVLKCRYNSGFRICICKDIEKGNQIIYCNGIKNIKKGSLIIDISYECNGGIESSFSTRIKNPIYDNIYHYVVDNIPSLIYRNISVNSSKVLIMYLNELISNTVDKAFSNDKNFENSAVLDNIVNFKINSDLDCRKVMTVKRLNVYSLSA